MPSENLRATLESELNLKITSFIPIGGGSINQSFQLQLKNQPPLFLKTHTHPPNDFYQAEALGLCELKKANSFRIPEVILHSTHFLVLEWIESANKTSNFYQTAGKLLAKQHQLQSELGFGFSQSNFIGLTPQENTWTHGWITFWKNRRLGPQIRKAASHLDTEMRSAFHELYKKIPDLLGDSAEEPPVLLHGDLWGGNHICDSSRSPCLIDPAVYYGNREADLAMTTLFSGYPREFHESYEKSLPLKAGFWEKRIYLYQLYHLLNHLNLFGASYLTNVKLTLQTLLTCAP